MENDSSGKAERENYETQNDCSTAFRNPAVLGSWMRKRSSDRQEHRSIVVSGSDGNSGGRRKSGGLIVQRRFYSQPVHPHLLKALEMKEKKQTKNE